MSNFVRNNMTSEDAALEAYFGDLLSEDGTKTDVSVNGDDLDKPTKVKDETVRAGEVRKRTSENENKYHKSTSSEDTANFSELTRPQVSTDVKTGDLKRESDDDGVQSASSYSTYETPEKKVELTYQPKVRAPKTDRAETKPNSSHSQDAIALLEEEKRRQLQKLLSTSITESKVGLDEPSELNVNVQERIKQALQVPEEIQAQIEAEPVHVASVNDILDWGENGRPVWAQERFDVLLFEVHGLTLAVPLVALGQIVNIDKLTPLVGQSDWFMGLLSTPFGDIKTVNTALLVMPEKYDSSYDESANYVISIDGMSWGLAVDKVNQPVTLSPDDVKWRTDRTKRAWLAGTVKEKMCALLDIPQMGRQLENSDKNRRHRLN